MKFPVIKTSIFVNILIIIISLFISALFLLFGIANIINPDVPQEFLKQNTIVCLVYCGIGVLFSLIAIASFRGILFKNRS